MGCHFRNRALNLVRHAWLLVAALSFLVPAASAREPAPFRVMTYNIRLNLASDGANAWPHRRAWVASQIEWLRPDLFGLQEVTPDQRADIGADLPNYRFIGGGRDDGRDKGEASPLAFDPKKFELLDSGMFWLSPTPTIPSKGWDAAYNRIVTWARLRARHAAGRARGEHALGSHRHRRASGIREADAAVDRGELAALRIRAGIR